jgi:PAS domain S-box-containing protein
VRNRPSREELEGAVTAGENTATLREDAARVRGDTVGLREETSTLREEREATVSAREDTAAVREGAASVREVAAGRREETSTLREDTATLREDAVGVREEAARVRQDLRDLPDVIAQTTGRLAEVGGWQLDVDTQTLIWTEEVYGIHEVDPATKPTVAEAIQFYAPESRPAITAAVQAAINAGTSFDLELPLLTARGRHIWVRILGIAERLDGKTIRVYGAFQDITKRKQLEVELDSLARFPSENPNPVLRIARDGTLLFVNDAALHQLPLWHLEVGHASPALLREAVVQCLDDGTTRMLDLECGERLYSFSIASVAASGYANLYGSDITDRKGAEEALRERQHLLTESQRLGHVGSWFWDLAGPFQWSEETYRICGVSPDRFTPTPESLLSLIHPADGPAMQAWLAASMAGEEHELEFRIDRPDGTVRVLLGRGKVVDAVGRKPAYMAGTVQDITERKRTEEVHRLSEQLRSLHVDQTPLAVIEFDLDGRVREWNPAARTIFGFSREEAIGQHLNFFVAAPIRGHMDGVWAEILAHRGGIRSTNENVTKDGRTITCEWVNTSLIGPDGRPIGVASMAQDITERRRAEAEKANLEVQLRQAQKMESVGRLAGGVAHDFNNMLGVILGYAELALAQTDPAQPLHNDLLAIRSAANRSADLTRKLLAFARKQTIAPTVLDLNETVGQMLTMLRRLIGEDIDLVWRPAENAWRVKMDPSQIDQILANLCVNARDAIAGVGKVTIATETTTFDDAYCANHPGSTPGEYIRLAVSDDGCGMDTDTLSHMFEPFFTTKTLGTGTGLGLSTVYGIVKQNHGFINVHSEPGEGTTITIDLPRHVGETELAQAKGTVDPTNRGHETILIVEDDPALLKMTTRMLAGQGYTVLAAGSSAEAIRVAGEHAAEIHLVMTDVVMPEMNGRDLATKLLALYPNLKCLFMSGYTADVIAHHGVLDEGVHFLQKPFSVHDLAAKVREVLDQS